MQNTTQALENIVTLNEIAIGVTVIIALFPVWCLLGRIGQECLKEVRQHGVGRVVLIQHHLYHGWDNSYLIDAARRYPDSFVVVGMIDDTKPHCQLIGYFAANQLADPCHPKRCLFDLFSHFRRHADVVDSICVCGGLLEMLRKLSLLRSSPQGGEQFFSHVVANQYL